ncbi:MAG: tetratricopeptide repeat protein [Holophagales bacterium]|nr:tetratricopeptide repeat protein [Holophagales bacterium]MYG29942.1 tetratricopeptide repeat protein [Holophagales bacterium]MYI78621.1 tetratricopeptide repeat protein [Holophagales bacterium]
MGVADSRSYRRSSALALLLLVAALSACSPGEQASAPAPEPAIPHPELAELDPPLAREIEARRAALDSLLADQEASAVDRARAFGDLGRLYQAHRLLEPALACYREAHALDPESFAWAYYLGVQAAGAGDIETARPAFRNALDLRADDAPALVRLADLELEHGKVDEAELLYVRAAVVDDSAAVAYGMGRVAEERGEYAEAIEQFERALTLQPRASVIHYHLGQAYRELGEFDRAGEALARSGPLRVAMADPLMHELTTLAIGALPHLDRGHAAAREGRLGDAEAAYRQAVAADATNVRAHESLATLLVRRGDPEGAIEHFGVAVRLEPENAQTHSDLGVLLAEQGRNDRALEHLVRAVELEPGNGEARLGLGAVLAQTGSFEEAVVELEAALRQIPEGRRTPRLHFGLAEALVRTGRLEEALPHYTQVRDLDPTQGVAWLREATVLMGLGRFAEAKATLEERLRVDSTDGRAAHSLARLLAGAPDPTLRDGPRAMTIAGALLQADNAAPNAETAAMALAEVGRFEEAVSIQRTLVEEARRRGRTGEERRLTRNLERYERSEACCARVADAFPPY